MGFCRNESVYLHTLKLSEKTNNEGRAGKVLPSSSSTSLADEPAQGTIFTMDNSAPVYSFSRINDNEQLLLAGVDQRGIVL